MGAAHLLAAHLAGSLVSPTPGETVRPPRAAGPPGWHLRWSGRAVGCEGASDLWPTVLAFMSGERLPAEVLGRVWIDVRLTGTPGRISVDLQVRTPLGHSARRVEVASCSEAVQGSAIIVAVALDPLRVAEVASPAARGGPPVPRDAAAHPPRPSARSRRVPVASPRRSRPRPVLGAAVVLDHGSLDAFSGGVQVGVGVALGRAHLGVRGLYLGPVEHHPFGDEPNAGVRVQLGAAGVYGCFVPRLSRVEFPACAHVEAGAVRGKGLGVMPVRLAHEPWVAAGAEAGVGVRVVGPLVLWLRAGGAAVLLRPRFFIDELGTVYRPAPALFRLALGPEVRF